MKLVELMLKNGANVNAPTNGVKGRTALQAAAERGNVKLVRRLISLGADVNAAASPVTCLQAAAEHGRLDIVSLLLKNDTETEGMENKCEKAAKLAERNGHIYISKMLGEYKRD